jgi:hypothetical protein
MVSIWALILILIGAGAAGSPEAQGIIRYGRWGCRGHVRERWWLEPVRLVWLRLIRWCGPGLR